MSGGEYAPKDSRDVTLRPSEPGKSTGWHDRGPDGDAPEDKMAPDDQRNVTGAAEPGKTTGWRETEGQGKQEADPDGVRSADDAQSANPGGDPPAGVPQGGAAFSAEEAAAARSRQE